MIRLAAAVLILAAPQPALARDMVRVLKTRNHNVLLIDRDSVKSVEQDGAALREAVLSLDNSASPDSANFYAADIKMRADCAGGRLAVVWARTFAADGTPQAAALAPRVHGLAEPREPLERAALGAICEAP